MSRGKWMGLFIVLVLSVLLMSSGVIASFFAVAFSLSHKVFVELTLGIWLVSLIYMAGEWVARRYKRFFLKYIGAVALGLNSISLSVVLLGFMGMILGLNLQVLGVGAGLAIVVLSIASLANNLRTPEVTRLKLSFDKTGDRHLHVVQISDIHLDGLKTEKWVDRFVDAINDLSPDLICFTGDLFDVDPQSLQGHFRSLSKLSAPLGKLAVSGNHDFYSDYQQFSTAVAEIGFELIDEKRKEIEGIYFVGVSDKDGKRFSHPKVDIHKLLQGRDKGIPTVVLDHRPENFEYNASGGIQLQLSGHTHWGQLPPWDILVRLKYRYAAGLKSFKEAYIYTSKGSGTWGPPMRLFGRSEIVSLDIQY
ncbi:MAG: putative MPP superfamily phosphohydrolase [Candidatus Marinamargulisbacteria bacterium]|jgi:predicted MPP superfamily phosphohydrolase